MTDLRDLLAAAAGPPRPLDLADVRRRAARHQRRRLAVVVSALAVPLVLAIPAVLRAPAVRLVLGGQAVPALQPGPAPSSGFPAPSASFTGAGGTVTPQGVVVPDALPPGAGPGVVPTDGDLAELTRSGLPVLVPERLPEWARDASPAVEAQPGSYRLTWRLPLSSGDPAAEAVGADLVLEVAADRATASPPPGRTLETVRRTYQASGRCGAPPGGAPEQVTWAEGDLARAVDLSPPPCEAVGEAVGAHDVLLVADSLAPPTGTGRLAAGIADAALATAPEGFAPRSLEGSEPPVGPPFAEVSSLALVHRDGTVVAVGPGTTAPGPGGGHYLDQLDGEVLREGRLADGRLVLVLTPLSGTQHELTFRVGDALVLLSLQGPIPEGGGEDAPGVDVEEGLAWAQRIVLAVEGA